MRLCRRVLLHHVFYSRRTDGSRDPIELSFRIQDEVLVPNEYDMVEALVRELGILAIPHVPESFEAREGHGGMEAILRTCVRVHGTRTAQPIGANARSQIVRRFSNRLQPRQWVPNHDQNRWVL